MTEHNRGWEGLFLFAEIIMIIFFCVGVTMEEGTHSHTADPLMLE